MQFGCAEFLLSLFAGEEDEDLPEEPSLEGNDRTVVPWKLADQDTLKASPVSNCHMREVRGLKIQE